MLVSRNDGTVKSRPCSPQYFRLKVVFTGFGFLKGEQEDRVALEIVVDFQASQIWIDRTGKHIGLKPTPQSMNEFETYLSNIGKSAKTARNYSGAIQGSISQWAIENHLTEQSLLDIEDVVAFEKVAEGIRRLDIYTDRNTVGNGMYNAALNAFSQFLADERGVYLDRDLDVILSDKSTDDTEKKLLVSTRLGQGQFRKRLIQHWKGCAATGYRGTRLLVASHIKPWRLADGRERLDPFNGLLLIPNLDKAFDLGYISFKSNGNICVSSELEEPSILGVHMDLAIKLEKDHQNYLAFHRENVFRV